MSQRLLYNLSKKVLPLTITILMIALLFANLFCLDATAVSSQYEAGVNVGDWVEYEINYTGNHPPVYPVSARREILNVKGTVLTVNTTYLSSDETFTNNVTDGDVLYGNGSCALVFIPANLGVGDIIHVQDFEDPENPITISAETTRTYLGVTRTVLYAAFTGKGFDCTVYWDKEKGTGLEINGVGTYTIATVISGTNMWSSGDPLQNLKVAIFMIILISLGSILTYGYLQSQKKTRKRKKKP
jgi:hypothetical protein